MFGLEDQKKKKKPAEFIFDLESDLKNPEKNKALNARIQSRIQKIKTNLQDGMDKSDFDVIGKILYGYSALLKVIARVSNKP